mmetsp:Transcript_51386/g.111849  ORF Transcript_51386/g.111849 Transcript_51386/m.111849 type:complete len:219 (-) Transcript_51386:585-1241(-)
MHLQNRHPALHIRRVHLNLSIEAARSHQRLIQDVRAIGGCDDHHALVAFEAIHLCQKLIHRLLALIVALAETSGSLTAHSINLIDEDDAGSILLGLFEEITNTGCADPREDLHELRRGDAEEGHTGLAGHSLGQQGLSGSWWAHKQRSFGDLSAKLRIPRGVLQEIDHLHQFRLCSVAACHVGKFHLGVSVLDDARLGFAQLERISAGATRAARASKR